MEERGSDAPGPALACPVCRLPLALDGRTYRCDTGHAFDRAREGYVDLLPVGHGRSGITGDTAAMARARQRFLGRGHYRRLSERVIERVAQEGSDARVIADAGCGTGHYIGAIAAARPGAALYGFDISREALRLAARAHPGVTFAVNDLNHRLCLPDGSVDVLLDIFAPRNVAEFRRVLQPSGLLVVVIPGGAHLAELREALPLLSVPAEKRERTLDQLAPGFVPDREEALEWQASLDRDEAAALVAMTPSAFHLPEHPASITRILPEPIRVTFSFRLMGLRLSPPSF